MTDKPLRELITEDFDIARKEGMLHSKDGIHSESSKSDASSILFLIAEQVKAIENPYKIFSPGYSKGFESCRDEVLKLLEK